MSKAEALAVRELGGERHRHSDGTIHAHPHAGPHTHGEDGHGHSHGLIDPSIMRSRAGLRAVGLSLGVLGATAAVQAAIYAATGSVALLADLIHNFGDALTALQRGRGAGPSACRPPVGQPGPGPRRLPRPH